MEQDTLASALHRRRAVGAAGGIRERLVARGPGWQVLDLICTCGPDDRMFEERHTAPSISLVLAGGFACRCGRGEALLAAGSLFLGNPGEDFECHHRHGAGDRCLSFQYEPEFLARLAREAGAAPRFATVQLPATRALAPILARARIAIGRPEAMEDVALDLAGTVFGMAAPARGTAVGARHHDRIARVLRHVEASLDAPHTLTDLAAIACLSPYHFLRTFKTVTGLTPHQWLRRARLQRAAVRLANARAPVTQVALESGFEDLSNFIAGFRAEFGVSPGRYRDAA